MVRISRSERKKIEAAAKLDGATLSAWCRSSLIEAAGGHELEKPPIPEPQPRQDISKLRVSPEAARRALVKPAAQAPVVRQEGKKPGWWDQLVKDTLSCPGKAPA